MSGPAAETPLLLAVREAAYASLSEADVSHLVGLVTRAEAGDRKSWGNPLTVLAAEGSTHVLCGNQIKADRINAIVLRVEALEPS